MQRLPNIEALAKPSLDTARVSQQQCGIDYRRQAMRGMHPRCIAGYFLRTRPCGLHLGLLRHGSGDNLSEPAALTASASMSS